MNEVITINQLIWIGGIIAGAWGFVKIIMEIIKAITTRHDREQKWDEMADSINSSREGIIQKYDKRLEEMEKKIDENHADTEAKLQQLRSEQCILTSSMFAVLDGLEQLGANHKVTSAKLELQEYLNKATHAK